MAKSGVPLVIVESPAKARTLARFLGSKYRVEASYGHIRDLPESAAEVPAEIKGKSWGRMGVDTDGDFTPYYVVPADKKKNVTALKAAMKDASELILATDPDREGESISWHLKELLKPKVKVRRIVFHEITEEAVKAALADSHDVDENLVRAQESRRILDRLYGYTLSPVLWKKVQTGLSAGRVQSVAVRVIVEREEERLAFTGRELLGSRGEVARRHDGVRRDAREGRRPARRDRQGFRQQGPARIEHGETARREGRAVVARDLDAPPAVDRHERRRETVHAASLAAIHDVDAAAGSEPQARVLVRADDADRAAAVPGHGPWRRRSRRRDFVSPNGFDHAEPEGIGRGGHRGEGAVWRRVSQPAPVSDQGPQRPGSARSDSPHALPSHAGVAREDPRVRRAQSL